MRKGGAKLTLALGLGLLMTLSACAAFAPRGITLRPSSSAKRRNFAKKFEFAPPWIQKVPEREGFHFFVGESQSAPNKEQALERAWISAFVRAGMTQFPELSTLTTESVEKLKESSFERRFAMKLEQVNWTGMEEATDLGSPYVEPDIKNGKFSAHRLLRWPDSAMALAKNQVRDSASFHLPASPEATRREERQRVDAVQAVEALNDKISRRNAFLEEIFSKVKCGVTVKDLIQILGRPDREYFPTSRILGRQLYWGPFRVERLAGDPGITQIERENGPSQRWLVCRGALRAQLVGE